MRAAALFDLDHTLLDTSSGRLYGQYIFRLKRIGRRELAHVLWWNLAAKLGLLDMANVIPKLLVQATGEDEAAMRELCDRWFASDVIPHLTERGRARVREHQAQGDVVALVSASTQHVVRPMADYLGIPGQFVCTHLVSAGGRFTGEVVEPVCYGQGKVVWAERFAAEWGVDLADSTFYSDSISDLPLMERVGRPVAVNPDMRLKRVAQKRGWPVERFY